MTGRTEARERVRPGIRAWFFTPPRRHGEVDYTREVSFLELFYDLVYVVLIAQVSHHLATHVGWRGVWEFVVVFGLIWLAWFNGTGWHELHGRDDGRARNYIFTQMMLLAVLAVFAEGATGESGPAFAITYAILFSLYSWQWWLVHRIDDPVYRPVTTSYLAGMMMTVLVMAGSAFVGDAARLWIWTILLILWIGGSMIQMLRSGSIGLDEGITGSLVERFGLFTIIVLGEVVVGVVSGISDAETLNALTIRPESLDSPSAMACGGTTSTPSVAESRNPVALLRRMALRPLPVADGDRRRRSRHGQPRRTRGRCADAGPDRVAPGRKRHRCLGRHRDGSEVAPRRGVPAGRAAQPSAHVRGGGGGHPRGGCGSSLPGRSRLSRLGAAAVDLAPGPRPTSWIVSSAATNATSSGSQT